MADQPPSHMPHYDYRDDEISLYELWNTLVKRRVLIGVVLAASVILAAAYAIYAQSTVQTQFRADAIIEIGVVPSLEGLQAEPIESATVVVTRLNEIIIPNVLGVQDVSVPNPRAEVLNADAGLVQLSVTGPIEQIGATEVTFSEVFDRLSQAHQLRLEARQSQIQEIRESVARDVAAVDAVRAAIVAQSDGAGAKTIEQELAATLSSIVGTIISLDGRGDGSAIKRSLLQSESRHNTAQKTAIARDFGTTEFQTQTRSVATVMTLGAVLGLMLGVFAAFGREFLEKAAAERAET